MGRFVISLPVTDVLQPKALGKAVTSPPETIYGDLRTPAPGEGQADAGSRWHLGPGERADL